MFLGTLDNYIAGDKVCHWSEGGKEERKVYKQKRSVAEKSRINSSKEDGNIALADVFPRVELLPRKSNLRWKITR